MSKKLSGISDPVPMLTEGKSRPLFSKGDKGGFCLLAGIIFQSDRNFGSSYVYVSAVPDESKEERTERMRLAGDRETHFQSVLIILYHCAIKRVRSVSWVPLPACPAVLLVTCLNAHWY